MGDFSSNYTEDKKGYIFFNLGKKTVKFKPFIDSFNFTFSSKLSENDDKIYNKQIVVKDFENVEYSIKFNVLATNINESIENHKKYQKLLRMMLPIEGQDLDVPKIMRALFSNLISKNGKSGTNYFRDGEAFDCIISNLNYSPIMELGFFEFNGLLFAKGFSLDVKMTAPVSTSTDLEDIPLFQGGYYYGNTLEVEETNTQSDDSNDSNAAAEALRLIEERLREEREAAARKIEEARRRARSRLNRLADFLGLSTEEEAPAEEATPAEEAAPTEAAEQDTTTTTTTSQSVTTEQQIAQEQQDELRE